MKALLLVLGLLVAQPVDSGTEYEPGCVTDMECELGIAHDPRDDIR